MSCFQQDIWAANSTVKRYPRSQPVLWELLQQDGAELCSWAFICPLFWYDCREMHFLFIAFCTSMPFHMAVQVVLGICASMCSKVKCIFVCPTLCLALFVPGMKLCMFKQHTLPLLQFLPRLISTKRKWPLVLVLLHSVLNCFLIKVIMTEEGIF